jgi:hypothetical protein
MSSAIANATSAKFIFVFVFEGEKKCELMTRRASHTE